MASKITLPEPHSTNTPVYVSSLETIIIIYQCFDVTVLNELRSRQSQYNHFSISRWSYRQFKLSAFFANKKLDTAINNDDVAVAAGDGGDKDEEMVVGSLAAGDVENKN